MPFSELMMTGIQLMFIGMGIVFAFLIVLVATMNGMSRLVASFESKQPAVDVATKISSKSDKALISVISAAIRRYRDTDTH